MDEGGDKSSNSLLLLSPRRKLALILVVMLVGVVASDPSFLRDSQEKPRDIQSFDEIDAFLAEFESQDTSDPNAITDAPPFAPPFEANAVTGHELSDAGEEESSVLVIPSAGNDVPVQTVSLPEPAHDLIDASPSQPLHIDDESETTEPPPSTPQVSIRLTGSIFPSP